VTVKRTSLPVSGDKLSTPHGQKGVMVIVPDKDVPSGKLADGSIVDFDIVMSLTAVFKRQTIGQVYEAAHGWLVHIGAKPAHELVNAAQQFHQDVSCELVYQDGIPVMRSIGGVVSTARASFGIAYVLPMTQLSYDKQHYTHTISGSSSIEPVLRRSRGGALRLGEMELLAMADSGLSACMSELRDRSNVVEVDVCTTCSRLSNLCTCVGLQQYSKTLLPSDMVKYDHILACTYACSFEYQL
jgi:DNA-directed RNA polymerase beta subunit